MTYDPSRYRDAYGRMLPASERNRLYREEDAQRLAARAASQAKAQAAIDHYMANRQAYAEADHHRAMLEQRLSRPQTTTKEQVFARDLDELKRKFATASEREKPGIATRIRMTEETLAKLVAERERGEKVAAVSGDKKLVDARKHALSFAPPDPQEAAAALAASQFIAREFSDLNEAQRAISIYWQTVNEIMARSTQRLEQTIAENQAELAPSVDELAAMRTQLNALQTDQQRPDAAGELPTGE